MAGKDAFKVEGGVIEARPNRTFCCGVGQRTPVAGVCGGPGETAFAGLAPGDKVKLQLTPYDLSVGRILVETKTI